MSNQLEKRCKAHKLKKEELISYGPDKAKVKLQFLKRATNSLGKLILVTGMTPTDAGEGKTTVAIGLSQAINLIEKNSSVLSLREPSLGPTFGMKGGATGGGASVVVPTNDINLHFTGDFHAVTAANNLIASLVDWHIFYGNELEIKEVVWERAIDLNDRFLRSVQTKIRPDSFNITAASEIMAIMSLATSIYDLRGRLGRILIGFSETGKPVRLAQIGPVDAVLALLVDSLQPNVVLTNEETLAFIHMGPFANIAHGCSSVLATKMSLALSKYTVTEAGFGADLGMEKFMHIKRPILEKDVDVCVIVVTIKALKEHGDGDIGHGYSNLEKHIENIKLFGLSYVVAINSFSTDQQKDLNQLATLLESGKHPFELTKCYEKGGKGSLALAKRVMAIDKPSANQSLYQKSDSIEGKIFKIATMIYGAKDVAYSENAKEKLKQIKDNDWDNLNICIAKTPASLSGNFRLKGRPENFTLSIDDLKFSLGAGFVVALTKGIVTLPGLNRNPRAFEIEVLDDGTVKGIK